MELLDVSEQLPALMRMSGLRSWRVKVKTMFDGEHQLDDTAACVPPCWLNMQARDERRNRIHT